MTDSTAPSPPQSAEWRWKQMHKSSRDSKIAGVCGGLGEFTPVPSWIWRVLFLTTAICGGAGLIAYAIFWICMPNADPGQ